MLINIIYIQIFYQTFLNFFIAFFKKITPKIPIGMKYKN